MSFTLFESLFGSKVRARLIRLFILNPELELSSSEVAEKVILPRVAVAHELQKLRNMGFVQEHSRKRVKTYRMHPQFPFFTELSSLVAKSNVNVPHQTFRRLRTAGDVKLILAGGIFLNHAKGKADLILVINNVHRNKLKIAMDRLEAEIGREVRFVLMDSDDLHYRLNMLDRFLVEFLEGPYQEIVNRIPELKRFIAGLKK